MAADFYQELGVSKTASADEIKSAYKKLAGKYHPDKNVGDEKAEAKFKRVNTAYQVLSDPEKRSLYDEFGEEGLREGFNAEAARAWGVGRNGRRGGGRVRWSTGGSGGGINIEDLFGGGGGGEGGGVGDLFGDLFGNRSRARRGPRKGPDVASEITVDFADAIRGSTLELKFQDGGEPVTVRIPPGAADGDRVRVKGQGAPGPNGGPRGDLVIKVHVRSHPSFERDGLDLHLDLPVTVGEAYRGAKVPVPTPTGEVTLTVPERAQSGQTVRLKGKGVKRGTKVGDLYVRFLVKLPDRDDPKLRDAVDVLDGAMQDADVRGDLRL